MKGWLAWAFGGLSAYFIAYWKGAPTALQAAAIWLPVCMMADGAMTLLHGWVVRQRPLPAADSWQAVTVSAVITTTLVALALAADAIGGLHYSFVLLALFYGYTTHVARTVRHIRAIGRPYQIPAAGFLDDMTTVNADRIAQALPEEDAGDA